MTRSRADSPLVGDSESTGFPFVAEARDSEQFRGGHWTLRRFPGAPSDTIDHSNFVLDVVGPHVTAYHPLTDAPTAYLDFADFGEDVWLVGVKPDPELIVEAQELHSKYGPIWREPIWGPEAPPLADYFRAARLMALAVGCYGALRPSGRSDREQVIERLETVLASPPHIEDGHTSSTIELLTWMRGNSDLRSRMSEDDIFPGWGAEVVAGLISYVFQKDHVTPDIQTIPTANGHGFGWDVSLVAPTTLGAFWVQFAQAILERSTVRRCRYAKCGKLFTASRSDAKYCPPGFRQRSSCQELAGKARKKERNTDV